MKDIANYVYDFEEFIQGNFLYVDKTEDIQLFNGNTFEIGSKGMYMSDFPDITGNVPDLLKFPLMISIDNGESWSSPEAIEYGQGFLIGFGLKNAGEINAENVPMEIRVNGEVLKEKTFTRVKAGKSYVYDYGPFYWEPGEYTIDLIYDPDNVIAEADEDNNVFSYTVRVEDNDVFLPDLAPYASIHLTQPVMLLPTGEETWIAPEIVETGTGFKIGFGVKNYGTVTAENIPVQIRINDVIMVDKTIASIPRGGVRSYHFGTFGFDPGEYTISLVMDPYNELPESDESNNIFSYTFTVPGNQDWLIKSKWTSFENLFGTDILLNEYAPIDPDTGEKCGAGCGNVGRTQILAYFASLGYGFTIELTEEDAFLFDGKISIDGTEENAKANGTISFAQVNKLLEDFDETSAEDVAALCYASAVIMANEKTYEKVYERIGFKYSIMERRGKSDLWTEDGNLSDKAWEMLIRNIENGQPVMTGVPDPHQIIIDGYDTQMDMVHINFDFGIANGKRYVEKFGTLRGNGWYTREELDALGLQHFHYDITPDTEKPVAGKVICQYLENCAELSLDFTDDVGIWKKYYRIAGSDEWFEYTDKVKVQNNTTVYFKACDKGKNYSDVISYAVTELEAPPVLTITGNPENWTNQDVVLTAAADRGTIEFFNGTLWIAGTELIVTANGTYQFRVTDAAGVVTGKTVIVDKIDKVAPDKPVIKADVTVLTKGNVTLTAAFSAEAALKQYSFDNAVWYSYSSGVVCEENKTVHFREIDAAGNISEVSSYTVSNIDKTLPDTLCVIADITEPTRNNVTVTPVYTGNAVKKEYSLDQGGRWRTYAAPISVRINTVLYFRETDALGNVTQVIYEVTNIDKSAPDAVVACTLVSTVAGVTVDWAEAADNGTAGIAGYNFRYGKNTVLSGNGEFVESSCVEELSLENGVWYFQIQSVDKAGNVSAWSERFSVTVRNAAIESLSGSASGVRWQDGAHITPYTVEYSRDGFESALSVTAPTTEVDTYGMPDGTYQWRVNGIEGTPFTAAGSEEAQRLVSDNDCNLDLFFGKAQGIWEKGYAAQHLGSSDWQGTKETVLLAGKNRIADLFEGSADADILVLTDDSCGDALFVDDIYTALGDGARFSQMDEIRAGAGDDIVDMTSQRYAYTGDAIRICGGDGNDTLWGGAETNVLYGDGGNDRLVGASGNDILSGGAGNDAMHGGGGDDIFCFGGDFGNDTVEQLADGSVTLWFETGSESNWNADTLTYSDGVNTVSVSGSVDVTIRFGSDDTLPTGVFESETICKVFEDKGRIA